MALNRTHLDDRDADAYASLDDINDVYHAVNDLKDNAADMSAGLFTSSDLEIDVDSTVGGTRGIKFWLTASAWVRLFWDNTNTIFKLSDQVGVLQKLMIADGTTATHAATKGQVDAVQANVDALQLEVTGVIKAYGGSSAPTGYLLCDGSAVSRSTYAALFTAISTTFGSGNGSTTFNVPDLRDRLPLGKGNMGGTAANRVTSASTGGSNSDTLGGTGGAETHQLTVSELAVHRHQHHLTSGSNAGAAASSGSTQSNTAQYTDYEGGDQAHNNMPPWIALNYIIKT
jgi:microcystin-dependent protein